MITERMKRMIADLLDGKLDEASIVELQKGAKDPHRLQQLLEVLQERTGWSEPIVGLVQEHLTIVDLGGRQMIRCLCGHDFCDPSVNWKEHALVYERHPRDGIIYQGPRGADPDWMLLREFYCPGCVAQLEVEMVPPGYPFIFNYRPLPEGSELP